MKFCLVFAATLALAFGTPVPQSKDHHSTDEDLEKFIDALHRFTDDGDDFDLVNVGVNILVDDFLDDMRETLIEHHLNVIELRDENVELPEHDGNIHLTNGHLEDMASGLRYDEISVDHDRDNRILTFRVPLGFTDLEFNYEYKTTLNKEESSGNVEGKIGHIKLNLELVYDAKHGFAVEGVHLHDKGELTIDFNGHNLDIEVIEAIAHAVKTHLTPLLEEFTEAHVDEVADKVVEKVNEFINNHDEIPDDHDHHDEIPDDHDHHDEIPDDHDHHDEIPDDHDHHDEIPDDHDHHDEIPDDNDHHDETPDNHDHHDEIPDDHDHHDEIPDDHDHHDEIPDDHDHHDEIPDDHDHHDEIPDDHDETPDNHDHHDEIPDDHDHHDEIPDDHDHHDETPDNHDHHDEIPDDHDHHDEIPDDHDHHDEIPDDHDHHDEIPDDHDHHDDGPISA